MTHTEAPNRTLVFSLFEASARLEARIERSLNFVKGISMSEYQILEALRTDHPTTRVDLARAVGLTPSGVTRALRPLEKLGFVETTKDARDARRSLAHLTRQGRRLVNEASQVVDDSIQNMEFLEQLTEGDRERLSSALAEIQSGALARSS